MALVEPTWVEKVCQELAKFEEKIYRRYLKEELAAQLAEIAQTVEV